MTVGKDEAYNNLANAIILEAVKDYRKCKRKIERGKAKDADYDEIFKIETFFKSDYFKSLTNIDGIALLENLEKEKGK